MIRCPSCNTTYLEGTLFCEKCGATLSADSSAGGKSTDPLSGEPVFQDGPGTTPIGSTSAPATLPDDVAEIPPGSFALWIANSNRRQVFEMGKDVLIGRLDSANRVFPDLDLTAEERLGGDVSRRHSLITFHDDVLYVEDLQSTNHTYLNGVRLKPLMPHPLRHGDELRLGSVLLRVELPQPDSEPGE